MCKENFSTEQVEAHGAAIQAYLRGKKIEMKCRGNAWLIVDAPNFRVSNEYRIKEPVIIGVDDEEFFENEKGYVFDSNSWAVSTVKIAYSNNLLKYLRLDKVSPLRKSIKQTRRCSHDNGV